VINVGSGAGFAMVFSLLISSIVWNLGTWYLGLPASSSHTLIGSIVGVGLMNSVMSPDSAFGDGVNWAKVQDTVKALIFSPLIGFVLAALLLLLAKAVLRNPALYKAPEGDKPPPLGIRALLVLTCTGVSFAHGSNDGQKGMGLIVLILVGIIPTTFALDLGTSPDAVHRLAASAVAFSRTLDQIPAAKASTQGSDATHKQLTRFLRSGKIDAETLPALAVANQNAAARLAPLNDLKELAPPDRIALRLDVYLVSETLSRLQKARELPPGIDPAASTAYQKSLKQLTNFVPLWVKIAVSIALGLGTMIGWKRIVVTVGEKIGKAHLTYAQGASAELVAFATIEAADLLGLPVSTTHILSSGIAGTMVANGSGIQKETVRNIVLAWVLTLPVCVILGAALFGAALVFVLRVLGVH
jgi:PiT family inorganic phosphate transporter